jgi:hypothetical protein
VFLDLLTAFALFCEDSSHLSSKDNCNKISVCVLKELEGNIGQSQIEVNQEKAIEKCTREIVCGSGKCSKNLAR